MTKRRNHIRLTKGEIRSGEVEYTHQQAEIWYLLEKSFGSSIFTYLEPACHRCASELLETDYNRVQCYWTCPNCGEKISSLGILRAGRIKRR